MKHLLLKALAISSLTIWVVLNSVVAHPVTLQTTPTVPTVITLKGHTNTVTALAWSPDGTILASSAGYFDSQDFVVRLWQADGQPLAKLVDHTQPVSALAWAPDGNILATGSHDQTIDLWSKDGTLIQKISANAGIVFGLAWSPDGKTLASGSIADTNNNTVQVWDTNGKLIFTRTTQFSGGKFYNLGWSPDGKYLVGGATDYSEWKADGTLVISHESCASCTPAWGFAWSPDSQMWAFGNESGLIWVYDVVGKEVTQLKNEGDVNSMRWSPDGKWLAGGKNLWQVNGTQFKLTNYLKGLDGAMAWSPDSRYIASAGDKTVYVQTADGKLVTALKNHTDAVDVLAWSPTGDLLASGSADHTISLWGVSGLSQ